MTKELEMMALHGMPITPRDVAARLDGCEYRSEVSREMEAMMREHRIVAVYGASDDLAYLSGGISDEVGAGPILIVDGDILYNDCSHYDCPHYKKLAANPDAVITPKWGVGGVSWTYETSIPHWTFNVKEDGDIYCRGIVFSLDDIERRAR